MEFSSECGVKAVFGGKNSVVGLQGVKRRRKVELMREAILERERSVCSAHRIRKFGF